MVSRKEMKTYFGRKFSGSLTCLSCDQRFGHPLFGTIYPPFRNIHIANSVGVRCSVSSGKKKKFNIQ